MVKRLRRLRTAYPSAWRRVARDAGRGVACTERRGPL